MNTYNKNLLLFHQVIEPKLRRRARRLARGCEFTAKELLAGAADLFASRHAGGEYTEAQLVQFGGWRLLQHCRDLGLVRRKDSQAEPVCLVPLQDADQHPSTDQEEEDSQAEPVCLVPLQEADQYLAADRVDQQHRDTRLALLERALAHKSWVEPTLAQAIEQIWEGATIAETAQALGLTASGLHKKLRRLGRQLLAGERPVQRADRGSQRRESGVQMDLFCVGGV